MTLTNAEIAAIRERAEAASPGPWIPGTDPSLFEGGLIRSADGSGAIAWFHNNFPRTLKNKEFIMTIRTDIPALLDIIAELRDVIAAIVHDTSGWDIHGGDDYFVSADLVSRARDLLARLEGKS